MDRIRGLAPACSPAAACIACCEAEAGQLDDDHIHDADLSYANWMSDVSSRLWSIPLVRAPACCRRAAGRAHVSARLRVAGLAPRVLALQPPPPDE